MTTQKRIEANRRNAQKSTGPRTQAGKDAARLNAVKHGLRTLAVEVLPNEDADAFERIVIGWVSDLAPRTEAELTLARQAATISWKLDRAERYETAVLSHRVIEAVNVCECEDDDVQALHEAAAIASFDPSSEGERLRRYQFALMRELRQTIDAYAKLRKKAIASNEAISVEDATTSNEAISDETLPARQGKEVAAAPNEANSAEMGETSNEANSAETLPARQEKEVAAASNEAISRAEPAPITRVRRDRWPLETLKKRRLQEKRRQRQASAFAR